MKTLKGGREHSVVKEDGSTETVMVSQFKLGQYEKALVVIDDEFALAALACGKDKAWIQSLEPGSYEMLRTIVEEVNAAGFFVYAQRQQDKATKRINSVKPEVLQVLGARVSVPIAPGLLPRAA
jgi:hypothetical protein